MRSKSQVAMITGFVLSIAFVTVLSMTASAAGPPSQIRINSNADLAAQAAANGWPGNGSSSNPYIIANLSIDDPVSGVGIFLGNTSSYVNIENCTLSNANYVSDPYKIGAGIQLYNASNVVIKDTVIDAGWYGIFLTSSSDNAIINSTIVDVGANGIYIHYGSNNTIAANVISNAQFHAISLDTTNNTTASNNNITYPRYEGLGVWNSGGTIVSSNMILSAGQYGVLLYNATDGTVSNNTIVNSGADGICLCLGSSNIISNDNVSHAQGHAISLETTNANAVSSNTLAYPGDDGIYAHNANDSTIINNTITNPQSDGIYLDSSGSPQGSGGSWIANNTIVDSNGYGIWVSASSSSTIFNNTIFGGQLDGIYLNGPGSAISNNTISDLQGAGIFLSSSIAYMDGNALTNCSIMMSLNGITDVNAFIDGMIITSNNTINGNPVYFLKNENMNNASVPSGMGEVILLNVTYFDINGLTMNYGGVIAGFCSNITVRSNSIADSLEGIYLESSDHCAVSENNLTNSRSDGVLIESSNNNTVSNNTITGALWNGTSFLGSCNNIIANNTIVSGFVGIGIGFGSNNTLTNNNITSGWAGILLEVSSNNTVSNNNIPGSDEGIYLYETRGSIISKNIVSNAQEDGIYMDYGSENNSILNNIVTNAQIDGIYLDQANGSTIMGNRITNSSSYGIYLTTSSNNTMYENMLVNNNGAAMSYDATYIQAFDDGVNQWNSTSRGNYWSDWQSSDNNHDGIADSPYLIDGAAGAQDYLPIIMALNFASPIYTNQSDIEVLISTPEYVPLGGGNYTHYVNGVLVDQASINDMLVDQTAFSQWVPFHLDLGVNIWVITINDSAGNSVIKSLTIVYSTGPIVTVTPSSIIYTNQSEVNETITAHYYAPLTTGNCTRYVNGMLQNSTAIDSMIAGKTEFSQSVLFQLDQGTNLFVITVNDSVGNTFSFSIIIVYDTIAPTISITSPADNSYNNTGSVTMAWSGSDNLSGVAYYWISLDGGALVNVSSDTSHAFPSLSDGLHTVKVIAFDNAGNNATAKARFTVDATKPTVTIAVPGPDAWYNTTTLNVTWTASDEGSNLAPYFWISLSGGQWINMTDEYKVFSSLPDGQHSVEVRAFDLAGNYNDTARAFNVETVKPSVSIVSPISGSYFNSSTVAASWTAAAASGIAHYWISVDGGQWIDAYKSTSHTFASLADGTHTISVKVGDHAGNWNQTSASVVVDTTVPTVIAHSPTGDEVAVSSAVNVTFSEAMNETSVSIVVNAVTETLAWNSDFAMVNASSLAYNTTYTVAVTGKDLAGNALSSEWRFKTSDFGGIKGAVKDSNGNPVANATITLSNGMTTTTDASGAFSFDNVTAGSYDMTVTKDGYQTIAQRVSVTAGQTNDLGSLSVQTTAAASSASDGTFMIGAVALVIAALLVVCLIIYSRLRKSKQ